MDTIKAAKIGAYGIAAGAASLSYSRQRHLYVSHNIGWWSFIVPLMVDVLALLAAMARNTDQIPKALKTTAPWTLATAGLPDPARTDERDSFSAKSLITHVLTLLEGRGIRTRINGQTALIAAFDLLRALDIVPTAVVEKSGRQA